MEERTMLDAFRQWILEHDDPEYVLIDTGDSHQTIVAKTEYAEAMVSFTFLSQIIVEMKIYANGSDDESFYIHFEFKDVRHSMELFDEMIMSLKKMKEQEKKKIYLCCSSALTSTFFAAKLNQTAQVAGVPWEFKALSFDRLSKYAQDADVVLLAPQISYLFEKTSELMSNSVVVKVPARVFGAYDVDGMFNVVRKGLAEQAERARIVTEAALTRIHMNGRILVISVIVEKNRKKIIYRVYDHGEIETEDRILKAEFSILDIEDVIDVVLSWCNVDYVCVCLPGVVKDGILTYHGANIENFEADEYFSHKYGRQVVFLNDANAMALGWMKMQDRYSDIILYFHPAGAKYGGTGILMNGKLRVGHNSIAGEMQFLYNALRWSDDPMKLKDTKDGATEMAVGYLTALIACMDPEAIVIYGESIEDNETLRAGIAKNIREDCIPELIRVKDVVEIMFAGGLLYISEYRNHD